MLKKEIHLKTSCRAKSMRFDIISADSNWTVNVVIVAFGEILKFGLCIYSLLVLNSLISHDILHSFVINVNYQWYFSGGEDNIFSLLWFKWIWNDKVFICVSNWTLVSLLECFLVTKPEYIFSAISFLMLMCHVANNSCRMMVPV